LSKRHFPRLAGDAMRPSLVVLVPAHNESRGLLPTLADVISQLRRSDRLLVIADNCSDDTAELAEAAGAEVVKRKDLDRIGKGYALDFGLRHLRDNVPEVVIVLDADCRLEKGAIDQLAISCGLTGKPAQAIYVMTAPPQASIGRRIAEFAWRIKNDLRPRGLAALGLPCQLMGSGMAFPRKVIGMADLATDHLAEDLDLGLRLAFAGHAPQLCPTAVVRSEFPSTDQAAAAQRQRWEHGHLAVLVKRALPYLAAAARNGNWRLFALSLDAAVPPLILLGLLIATLFAASCCLALAGATLVPFIATAIGMVLFVSGLMLAWTIRGRDLLPAATLVSLIPYIASKFAIYARAFASDKKWVRTDRRKSD
jgi:cellulose synthase/poly-beta-1,6-N-acetylglucosamine synthase-like glycosyltransferase